MSYHIILYHVMSYHILSCHIILYHVISNHVHITSCHIMPCHKMSYHISYHIIYYIISYQPYHIISCQSYHIISYHILSYLIISYHILLYQVKIDKLSYLDGKWHKRCKLINYLLNSIFVLSCNKCIKNHARVVTGSAFQIHISLFNEKYAGLESWTSELATILCQHFDFIVVCNYKG